MLYPDPEERAGAFLAEAAQLAETVLFAQGKTLAYVEAGHMGDEDGYYANIVAVGDEDDDVGDLV
jgi:hypothetical protein